MQHRWMETDVIFTQGSRFSVPEHQTSLYKVHKVRFLFTPTSQTPPNTDVISEILELFLPLETKVVAKQQGVVFCRWTHCWNKYMRWIGTSMKTNIWYSNKSGCTSWRRGGEAPQQGSGVVSHMLKHWPKHICSDTHVQQFWRDIIFQNLLMTCQRNLCKTSKRKKTLDAHAAVGLFVNHKYFMHLPTFLITVACCWHPVYNRQLCAINLSDASKDQIASWEETTSKITQSSVWIFLSSGCFTFRMQYFRHHHLRAAAVFHWLLRCYGK